jgi:hypothetical protein
MSFPLRAVYDNSAERATISVSGSVVLPVANLHTNNKYEVWRSASTVLSVTFTATYFTAETVSCVAFPYCNFSSTATMRVRLYSDTACTVLLRDSGVVLCSEGAGGKVAGLTALQSASAYSYGGGAAACVWLLPTVNVLGIKIDVVDSANLQGYLEAARIVIGDYFSPIYNAEYGVNVTYEDTTANFRTDAGNLLSDIGTKHKVLSLNLSFMQPTDKAGLWKLVNYCGKSQPVFISVLCGHPDKSLEQSLTVYGKFTSASKVACSNYLIYSAPMEVEGL